MNNTTPDTPLDLLAMQRKHDSGSSDSFFEAVGELLSEHMPCPCEMQSVVERLTWWLVFYHETTLEEEGEEMHDWARATWKKDLKRLKKALSLIRDVH